ncbi:hypothetical protein JXB02_04365 [Candidatus Woesearchaeota archaeon]|nr:hypothetical protein [Candidatus Woesearchaeota archaeon]
MRSNDRKAQVTAFIVIGLIFLFAIGLFLYIREQVTVFEPEQVLPPELQPVKRYVDECLQQTAREAVLLAGANGGFIDIPDEILLDPFAGIMAGPFESAKVPLWYFEGDNRKPSLDYIQYEMQSYIEEHINDCLGDFEAFSGQFEISRLDLPEAEVTLAEKDIAITMTLPIRLESLGAPESSVIDRYSVKIPVRLKKAYELASALMNYENEHLFIEDVALDLIAMDPEIPYTDFEFRCQPRIWYVQDVHDRIQTLLAVNLPWLRINGTDFVPIPGEFGYAKNHYYYSIGLEEPYPYLKVAFTYDPSWDLDMYVRPNDGAVLRSDSQQGSDILRWFCMHTWHFTYDLVFPVMVTIVDEGDLDTEPFAFSFGFEARIDHNRGVREVYPLSAFEFTDQPQAAAFCNENPAGMVTIYTVNNETREDVVGVNITYTCLRYACEMGETEWLSYGAAAGMSKQFPLCINGLLRATKEGFMDYETFLSTDFDRSLTIPLTPLKALDYDVIKMDRDNPTFPRTVSGEESALIMLRAKDDTYRQTAYYPNEFDEPLYLLADRDVTYDVDVYIMDADGMTGGYKGEWAVAWDDLYYHNTVRFFVVEDTDMDEDEMFEFFSDLETISGLVTPPQLI